MQDFYSTIQIKAIRLGFSNGDHHDVSMTDTNGMISVPVMASFVTVVNQYPVMAIHFTTVSIWKLINNTNSDLTTSCLPIIIQTKLIVNIELGRILLT